MRKLLIGGFLALLLSFGLGALIVQVPKILALEVVTALQNLGP